MARVAFRTIEEARVEERLENLQQRKKEIQHIHSGIKASSKPLSDALQEDGHRANDALLEIHFVLKLLQQLFNHIDFAGSLHEERLIQERRDHVQRRKPRGSFLILGASALPLAQAILPLAYAIGGGNTAVLLLSAGCPATSSTLMNCLEATRLDTEAVRIVSPPPDGAIADYAALPFAGVVVQDSCGLDVVRKAAACDTLVIVGVPRPCPVIITRHADVEKAAEEVARARFLLRGLSPTAPSMLFVEEAVLPQFLTTLTDVTRRYLQLAGTDKDGTSVNDATMKTEFEKAGGRLVDVGGTTFLVGSPDWRGMKQIPNGIIPDADGLRSRQQPLPIFSVTSMDAALALHAQVASTITLRDRPAQSPPAAYLFGNPSETRYLSLFVSAGSVSINCIPPTNLFAALPILPVGLALDNYTKPSPVITTATVRMSLPEHIWSLPKAQILHSINALIEADGLEPPKQKLGKNLPFFPQGILMGTSHLVAVLGVGALCAWYVVLRAR